MKSIFISILLIISYTITQAQISDLKVIARQNAVCSGTSTDVVAPRTQIGYNYELRDVNNNALSSSVPGNGRHLVFNTGPLTNSDTFNVYASGTGSSFYFDGNNTFVAAGTHDRTITRNASIAAWVKTTSNIKGFMVSKFDGLKGYVLFMNANGTVNVDGRDGSGNYRSSGSSTTAINDGQWHFVVGTIDATFGFWNIYVDGVLESSASVGASGTTNLTNSGTLYIGRHEFDIFEGEIDDVSIWNATLPLAAVNNYYTNCVTGNESNLVGFFPLNEGMPNVYVANDISVMNLDGTINGNYLYTNYRVGNPASCNYSRLMTQTAPVMVTEISEDTLSVDTMGLCLGSSVAISTTGSTSGLEYCLKDDLTDSLIHGPVIGTGAPLNFATSPLNGPQTLKLEATKKHSNVLHFDGINDYVSCGTLNSNINRFVTVSAWVKADPSTDVQAVVSKYDGINGYMILINTDGTVKCDGRTGGAYKTSGPSTTSITDGQWHRVTGAINAFSDDFRIYVDGVLENQYTGTGGNPALSVASNADLQIGKINLLKYKGLIDDVVIWYFPISDSTINAHYTTCIRGDEESLSDYFPMDESSDIYIKNLGTGNTALMTNMDPATGRLYEERDSCITGSCTQTMSQTLTISPTNIDTTTMLSGFTLTANQSGATYQWLDCNNSNSPIANETGFSFDATTYGNGDYAVEITYNGCVDTSACQNVTGVGINQLNNNAISIFPNPTNGYLNITSDQAIEQVIIYNINGSILKNISNNPLKINVSDLPQGLYILELKTSNGILQSKFIKE